MKVSFNQKPKGVYFRDIKAGEVFYREEEPSIFLLRADGDDVVAVNIATGALYFYYEFESSERQYHVINAEVILDTDGNI